jgi:uncharacterized protein (DUF58 family)
VDPARDPRPGAGPVLKRRGLAARLRRQLRAPRTLRPTRAGWVFFGLTFGVGFAALNTGNNLLYLVLSLLLAFLVLSGTFSESALRGIHVRRVPPAELVAERAATVLLEVTNHQARFPSFAVVVEDLLGDDLDHSRTGGRVFALKVPPGGSARRTYSFVPAHRGELEFAGFRVTTRFPFGLFSKSMRIEEPARGLVYPALDESVLRPPEGRRPRDGEDGSGGGGERPESAGLRDYAPGDPLRRVHWRASLRRGTLLVRELEEQEGAQHTVRLATAGMTPGEAFETAVRRAASAAVAHLDAGWRVGLATDSIRIAPQEGAAARRRILAFLARVAPDGGPAAEETAA